MTAIQAFVPEKYTYTNNQDLSKVLNLAKIVFSGNDFTITDEDGFTSDYKLVSGLSSKCVGSAQIS